MRPLTIGEARFVLSHVFCVHCLPDKGGWSYQWAPGFGEALCSRCPCREPADLRLYVASVAEAEAYIATDPGVPL